MKIKNKKVFSIGLGRLGLIFSHIICDKGFEVYGYDKNLNIKKDIYNKKKNLEPKLNNLIQRNKKKFKFCENLEKSINETSMCILALPTPSKKNHEFDNSFIFEVLSTIGKYLIKKKKYIINITSTVNPGSCNLFINFLEKKYSLEHGKQFIITYNPHLIALGQIYNDVINSELVIIGSDIKFGHQYLKEFYSQIYKNNIERLKFLNLKEAEISKISINAYVTLKISFSNTLSQIADKINNIDVSKIIHVVGSDSRIGLKYLGLGGCYSGPCFPRDSINFATYLKKTKIPNFIPIAADQINKLQIQRYIETYNTLSKKISKMITIGICGITYKKNAAVTDFSPGLQILEKLKKKGNILIHDESNILNMMQLNDKFKYETNLKSFFNKCDIIFICYKNEKFKEIQRYSTKNKKIVIDLWNYMKFKNKNIIYKALGVS
jgi:UDPglucose 6-dehydrogenase